MSDTAQQPVTAEVAEQEITSQQPTETFFARLVGINEAASITGKNKGQISRDSNAKRLPFMLDEKRQKRYKVADLFQIYGLQQPEKPNLKERKQPPETATVTTEMAVELAVLKEALRRADDEIRDLRQNRDRLLEQNQRLTLLLPAPPTKAPEPTSSPAPVKKSIWQRLFS